LVRYAIGLTEREKEILRLSTYGLSDYRISRKIKAQPNSVIRSHHSALRKIAKAQADLAFVDALKLRPATNEQFQPSTRRRFWCKIKF
jgi:DNA-binding NarL/FixJ family response regulator